MWIVFDRNGHLACLQVSAETARSISVSDGTKVPRGRVWMRLAGDGAPLLPQARLHAEKLDIEQLWTAANGDALSAQDLAGRIGTSDLTGTLAVLQVVLNHPAHFRRGEGKFMPVKGEIVERARDSLRRRALAQEEENEILAQVHAGKVPPAIASNCTGILAGENKIAPPFRAAKKAAGGEKYIPEWLVKIGACRDARECWFRLFEHKWPPMPQTASSDVEYAVNVADLPLAASPPAFSIDEAGTFEVDDAFSVRALPGSEFIIGVHIAVPALDLSLFADREYDKKRLTSVYFPDGKHPMLAPVHTDAFSLRAGSRRPALSLYCRFNPDLGAPGRMFTRLENVEIGHNYAPEDFDNGAPQQVAEQYRTLALFAGMLPPLPGADRTEFRIYTSPPRAEWGPRRPISMLVEKLMRLVNGEWGRQIANGKGGLFRSGGMLATRPDDDYVYAWLSSPLRRYADLANQRLLLSLLDYVPQPSVHWRDLARAYSSQQTRARHFQEMMERHWMLQILTELPAGTVLPARLQDNGKARLQNYPMAGVIVNGAQHKHSAGDELQVMVHDIDFFMQRVQFKLAAAATESQMAAMPEGAKMAELK